MNLNERVLTNFISITNSSLLFVHAPNQYRDIHFTSENLEQNDAKHNRYILTAMFIYVFFLKTRTAM